MVDEREGASPEVTWRDACGGALALLHDRFSDEDVAPLANRYPVCEGIRSEGEKLDSSRWPCAIDGALATLAARALQEHMPSLDDALIEVERCGKSAVLLRELVASYQGRLYDLAASAPDLVATDADVAGMTFAQAHLSVATGLTAYQLSRRLPSFASQSTAKLLELAMSHGMQPAVIVDALLSWAPNHLHASLTHPANDGALAVATWPDLALMVDGPHPPGLFPSVAERIANDDASPDSVTRALHSMRGEAPRAHGVGVALMGATPSSATWGTVHASPQTLERELSEHAGLRRHDDTIVLSSFPRDDLRVELDAPLSSLLSRLGANAGLNFALAALRNGGVPAPRLPSAPAELVRRKRTLHYLAETTIRDRRGLSVMVREIDEGETNALFEAVPTMQVVIVRDDSQGADDETAVAGELERWLTEPCFDSLHPLTVHGEYCK